MRIAVAGASEAIVAAVASLLNAVRGWRVVWSARDADAAQARCLADRPDVLLLAVDLPGPGVADATRRILSASPCAIVLLADGARLAAGVVLEALAAGALDRVAAPWVGPDGRLEGGAELARAVRTAAQAGPRDARARRPARGSPNAGADRAMLVAIGASTGGPAALATVLASLPPRFPAAVVVIQHVDARFGADLASWLGRDVALPVRAARSGEAPVPGTVLLATGDADLVMRPDLTLAYEGAERGRFFHPSVDVFFRSLAAHWTRPGIGVLLTGIGRDGAEGLLALRRRGWRTLAQDERTSVVYGMPKAAALLDAACEVLPIEAIGPTIVRMVAGVPGRERGAR